MKYFFTLIVLVFTVTITSPLSFAIPSGENEIRAPYIGPSVSEKSTEGEGRPFPSSAKSQEQRSPGEDRPIHPVVPPKITEGFLSGRGQGSVSENEPPKPSTPAEGDQTEQKAERQTPENGQDPIRAKRSEFAEVQEDVKQSTLESVEADLLGSLKIKESFLQVIQNPDNELPLRESLRTQLVKAIITAIETRDIERYNLLMYKLSDKYHFSWTEILLEPLSEKKSGVTSDLPGIYRNDMTELETKPAWIDILETMVQSNSKVFNMEVAKLLTIIFSADIVRSYDTDISRLRRVARTVNNTSVDEFLTNMETLLAEIHKHSHNKSQSAKEKLTYFLDNSKYNSSLVSAGVYTVLSGLFATGGYKLLSSSMTLTDMMSSFLPPSIATAEPSKLAGMAVSAMALMAGAQAIDTCRRAFKRKKQAKETLNKL